MKRLLSALAIAIASSVSPALASGPATVAATAGAGTPFKTTQDSSGNNGPIVAIGNGADLANLMAVKAASTAAVASDPSGVIQLSPNSLGGASGTPLFASITNTVPVSGTFWQTTQPVSLNTTPSLANGNGVTIAQGGSVLSATNPIFDRLTDGTNASTIKAASTASIATDTSLVVQISPNQPNLTTALNIHDAGIVQVSATSAANATGNPLFVTGTGTAGTAAANPITVQGIASMTPLLINPGTAANWGVGAIGSAVPANASYNGINVGGNLRGPTGVNPSGSVYATQMDFSSVAGTTIATGTGAQSSATPRVTVATDTATIAGSAPGTAGTASSNVISMQGIASMTPVEVSPTTAANTLSNPFFNQQAAATANTNGGYAYGIAADPTVTASAYTANQCLGGFKSVTVSGNNAQSGWLTNFILDSVTGLTPTVTVYVFEANPSSSTCTDHGTFTLNAADLDKMIVAPFSITLAAPPGATPSVGEASFAPLRPFLAGGSGSSVKTIYYGMTTSAITPASTTEFRARIGVAMN